MDDPVDLLEKRIKQLELQILPQDTPITYEEFTASSKNMITDLYIDTHTMIQTALSCREPVIAALKKIEQINSYLSPLEYLDPVYSYDGLDNEAHKKYALELYSEIKEITDKVKEFKMICNLADENLIKVTALNDQLQKLFAENTSLYEECQEVSNNVLKCVDGYNLVCKDINSVFAALEIQLSVLEEKACAKPSVDD